MSMDMGYKTISNLVIDVVDRQILKYAIAIVFGS